MTDQRLVCDYLAGSQEAFAELVRRHAGWVYSLARRRLRNAHLSEDVTQSVFLVLAQKASPLRGERVLSAWLFQVTRMTILRIQRDESRRHRRELQAAEMRASNIDDTARAWAELEPILDESVAQLRERDRRAVLLRFYERKSFAEVALAIGATEEAARKRVGRAVDRLRELFRSRQVQLAEGAAVSTMLLERVSEPAPSAFAQLGQAIAGEHARQSALVLAKGAISMMFWRKMRIAALWFIAVMISGSIGVAVLTRPSAWAQNDPVANASPPSTQPLKLMQAAPILPVGDIAASIDFYTGKLGFKKLWEWGDPPDFAAVARDNVMIYLRHETQRFAGSTVYLYVSDVDELHRDLIAKQVEIKQEPVNRSWGMREMLVTDPDGNTLRIGSVYDKTALPSK